MITKQSFIDFIKNIDVFEKAVDRIEKAISGDRRGGVMLFESDWFDAYGGMSDIFFNSHFTTDGVDLINGYLYDNLYKHELVLYESDLFEDVRKIIIETPEELWDYLYSHKKEYILDV